MKTNLRILGILLLGLFAISVVGCQRRVSSWVSLRFWMYMTTGWI